MACPDDAFTSCANSSRPIQLNVCEALRVPGETLRVTVDMFSGITHGNKGYSKQSEAWTTETALRRPLQRVGRRARQSPNQTRGRAIKLDLTADALLYHRVDDGAAEAVALWW